MGSGKFLNQCLTTFREILLGRDIYIAAKSEKDRVIVALPKKGK